MLSMTKLASFCLLSLALGVAAVADAAGTTTTYRLSGKLVHAVWEFSDGCLYSFISVDGSESLSIENGGPPSSSPGAIVSGSGFDCSTGSFIFFNGSGPVDLLEVSATGTSASLDATIPVQYCTSSPPNPITCTGAAVSVELSALAIAPPSKRNDISHMTLPDGTRINQHIQRTERAAQVTGTATLFNEATMLEFPLESGYIATSSSGSITITPP